MTSLRARIAALLIVAIITVVGLATLAASMALRPPEPAAMITPIARPLQAMAALADTDPHIFDAQGFTVRSHPAEGQADDRMTGILGQGLAALGPGREVKVTRTGLGDDITMTASLQLADGQWLIAQIPYMSPPPERWRVLALWVVLIGAGAGAVALYAAWMVTRPLQLLEDAAGRIGADGVLGHIPESGSAEIRATAQALNRLSAQLKSAMESRMRLIAAAGHDLRTPMTRMRLRVEFIADDEERAKWLADLEELDTIADSAISLVREEVNRETITPLRLDRLLAEIAASLQPMKYPVTLAAMPEVAVRAGPLALKRALQNLIINAATHGGGAEIRLTREGGQAVVSITDTGPGIPPDVIGQVFEPFFRVDPARRKILPGAGLGMAIAREIVERLGGTITILNRKPRGLEQRVVLPLARP